MDMNDEEILNRGGNEHDIQEYAKQHGADLTKEDFMPNNQSWEKEFDEKVKELDNFIPQTNTESDIFEFGYKINKNDWLYTVPDWGNIKKFIRSLLLSERQRVLDEVETILYGLLHGTTAEGFPEHILGTLKERLKHE